MKKTDFRDFSTVLLVVVMFLTGSIQFLAAAPASEDTQGWIVELRNYKHRFLKKELGLTREQEAAFFKIYDEMDEQVMKINSETRTLERKAMTDQSISNTELEAAARAIFEQKKKESEIELRYFDQLADVLTMKQLVRLKDAERKLAIHLMRHNNKNR